MKCIVTGANGQVGRRITEALGDQAYAVDRTRWDLSDVSETAGKELFFSAKWRAVFHCAAYTAVDKAESDLENLDKITVQSTEKLGRWCAETQTPLVFFSSDYVFSGEYERPIREGDAPEPVNAYGAAKAQAERVLLSLAKEKLLPLIIVRTQWVYDFVGKNFLRTILGRLKTEGVVRVVDDQIGQTTWAKDLAEIAIAMVDKKLYANAEFVKFPVIHMRQAGSEISWADFAEAIAEEGVRDQMVRRNFVVNRIPSSEYPVPARRPKFSILSLDKLNAFGLQSLDWRDALAQCFEEGKEELARL